jgi:catalase
MVPGIAPSADPMLQARMFAYPDAARYRLGVNYQQLPTNAPKSPVYSPYQRDGFATIGSNYGGDPNYVGSALRPTAFKGQVGAKGFSQHERWVGEVAGFTSEITDEDFEQARGLWNVLGRTEGQQDNFASNVAGHLKGALPEVQKETFSTFSILVVSVYNSSSDGC